MGRVLRVISLASLSTVLFACGPGAKLGGGKEGAAAALFMASGPTKSSNSALGSGLSLSPTVTVSCPLHGKASLSGISLAAETGGSGASLSTDYMLEFEDCATTTFDNPETEAVEKDQVLLNGHAGIVQSIDVSSSSAVLVQTLKGKLEFDGAFDDFLDADVTQKLEATLLGAQNGSVTITLDGTISTSSGTYTYSNEAITVTAGQLIAAAKK